MHPAWRRCGHFEPTDAPKRRHPWSIGRLGLQGLEWVWSSTRFEIEPAAVKENGEFETLPIAKAAERVFDPLNLRVEALGHRIDDAVREVREHVLQVTPDDAGDVDHGLEPGADGPGLPAIEERARGRDGPVVPDPVSCLS